MKPRLTFPGLRVAAFLRPLALTAALASSLGAAAQEGSVSDIVATGSLDQPSVEAQHVEGPPIGEQVPGPQAQVEPRMEQQPAGKLQADADRPELQLEQPQGEQSAQTQELEAVALRPPLMDPDTLPRSGPVHSLVEGPIEDLREIKESFTLAPAVDRAGQPDDLWDRIRMGFAMPELSGSLVRDRENWYAARPQMLRVLFDRGRRYLHHIVEEIERRGMPMELALLPMVESAFNPMAYSPAHASGLWQFIPSTGKRYDLEQNHLYDGRRDILASTNAALDYLQTIYEMHGDWHLALASYNWGENAVARAVERNRARGQPADYQSLTMPAETRQYVPKLQALKNIISDPARFGLDIDPIPNAPYFVAVPKTRDIDIRLAARLADMPVEELVALNPAHNRPVFFSAQSPTLVLPTDRAQVFLANLENHDKPLTSWRVHTFKRGDRLDRLAKQSGISLAQLRQANGITARTRVAPGFQVLLPIKGMNASFEPLPKGFGPPPAMTMVREVKTVIRKILYTVKRGDTLFSIADRYQVTVDDLRRWNAVGRLLAGQKLTIEQPSTVTTTSTVRKVAPVKARPAARSAKRTRG